MVCVILDTTYFVIYGTAPSFSTACYLLIIMYIVMGAHKAQHGMHNVAYGICFLLDLRPKRLAHFVQPDVHLSMNIVTVPNILMNYYL